MQGAAKFAEVIPSVWNNSGFNAYSANHPKGVVNPFALKELESFGCSTERLAL
jgi:hypothetical protein